MRIGGVLLEPHCRMFQDCVVKAGVTRLLVTSLRNIMTPCRLLQDCAAEASVTWRTGGVTVQHHQLQGQERVQRRH